MDSAKSFKLKVPGDKYRVEGQMCKVTYDLSISILIKDIEI